MQARWPLGIIVDLDNTLHDYNGAARKARQRVAAHMESRYSTPAAQVLERYDQILASEADVRATSGRDVRMVRLQTLLDSWPETRKGDAAELAELLERTLFANLATFEGALEALDKLRILARTLIVTEGFADVQIPIIRHLKIHVEPADLLVTRAYGVRKKDGSAYRLAEAWLGTPAGTVLVIGDNWSWDILAASQIGMWQIWVSPGAEAPSPSPGRFLGSVRRFGESPSVLLDRWRAYNSGARF